MFDHDVFILHQKLKSSYGPYTPFGSMLPQKQRLNAKLEKWVTFLRKDSPDLKADFSKKSLLGVWRLMLVRYDIVLHLNR